MIDELKSDKLVSRVRMYARTQLILKRVRDVAVLGAVLLSALTAATAPSFGQSADTLSQIQNALQSSSSANNNTGANTGNEGRPQDMTLQPAYVDKNKPAQTPPSRLEQIMSGRAGVQLRLFGYEDVGFGASVVVPQSGAVEDGYLLGPGDEVVVTLRGQENGEYRQRIDRNGQISVPRISPILAAGRTLGDFRADLAASVRRAYVSTQAFVSIGQLRQISVSVSGEVNAPGTRIVTGLSSPLDAILLSGGIKRTGSLRSVKLDRHGVRTTIDLYSVLTQHGVASQVKLTDGDRVIVPPLGPTVAVAGWVRRPGIYELAPGTDRLSVRLLMSLAGGLETRGRYRLSALRIQQDGSNVLDSLSSEAGVIKDGEVLFVQPKADQVNQSATLAGSSSLAGRYPVRRATSLSDILKEPGALGKYPDSMFGLVVRRDPVTKVASLVPFAPSAILASRENMSLNSDDVVRVFTTREALLLSADVAEFRRQIAISDERHRSPQDTARSQGYESVATAQSTEFDENGLSERAIVASLSPKTLGDGGVLSDRLPTNEFPPFGLTQSQSRYLRNAIPPLNPTLPVQSSAIQLNPSNQANQTNSPNQFNQPNQMNQQYSQDPTDPTGSQNPASQSDQNAPMQYTAPDMSQRLSLTDIQPSAALPIIRNPSDNGASNLEQQDASVDEFPSNIQIETFGQLARQLRVDPLVLAHFLNDNCVSVSGSSLGSGYYLVGPGTTVRDLVAAIGGLSNQTDINHVELISNEVSVGNSQVSIARRIVSLTDPASQAYELHPRDEIRFNPIDNPLDAGAVTLQGQVRYPGTYVVERGERLSELLLRAGGLTDVAYPYGTVFLRRSVARAEHEANLRSAKELQNIISVGLSRVGTDKISPDAFTALNTLSAEVRNAPTLGRVSVVADPVTLTADPGRDVILEAGDVVYIPQRPSTVSVLGEVNQPGTFIYSASASVDEYIDQAGGYDANSDESQTFVVLPNGTARKVDKSWLNFNSTSLPPGTTIVVQRDIAPLDTRQLILDVAQILQSLAISTASLAVLHQNN